MIFTLLFCDDGLDLNGSFQLLYGFVFHIFELIDFGGDGDGFLYEVLVLVVLV
jgi:hypothetical protein